MRAAGHRVEERATAARWMEETCDFLQDHHVVAWTRNLGRAERYALELGRFLRGMTDTATLTIAGTVVRDLRGFCAQLSKALGGEAVKPKIEGKGGVLEALRERGEKMHEHAVKRRFILWRDADVLLRNDAKAFGELADALMGAAAQAEYADEDLLRIERVIWVGGPALDVYAEDARGQFMKWKGVWGAVTGVERPPVRVYGV